jgi:predicted nucleic acid-binding protein
MHKWVTSEAVLDEVSRNPDAEQRELMVGLLRFADEFVTVDEAMWASAAKLTNDGLAVMDALHLAVAEGRSAMCCQRRMTGS